MSEETKQPAEETPEEPQEAPQEEAPPAEEKVPDEKAEKAARGKKKKEKTYTLTREQMEAAELAARQLESVSTTTTASAPLRRKTISTRTPRRTPSRSSWRCTTTWSGLWPLKAMRTLPTRRGWR